MAFPKIDACLVCEGIRPEASGKHLILGFFGTTPHTRVAFKNVLLPATLCFVFCGGGGEGRFNVDLRVTDDQGLVIPNPVSGVMNGTLDKARTSTVVFMAFGGTFGKYGRFHVALLVNGVEHYSTTVDIDPIKAQGPVQ